MRKNIHLLSIAINFAMITTISQVYTAPTLQATSNGLIFYDVRSGLNYLPPTISAFRNRVLAGDKYSDLGSIWSTFGQPCSCQGVICGCCAGVRIRVYDYDQKVCANITFVPDQEEAILNIVLNETSAAKYGISARDPSPFCVPVMMGLPMAMCVQISNIAIIGNNLNMCMDFLVRMSTTDLFEMHFQCMRMGLDGLQYLDKNGQPVLPSSGAAIREAHSQPGDYSDDNVVYRENSDDWSADDIHGSEKGLNNPIQIKTAMIIEELNLTGRMLGINRDIDYTRTPAESVQSKSGMNSDLGENYSMLRIIADDDNAYGKSC